MDARNGVDGSGEGDAGADEGLERLPELERSYADGADLADARRACREAGRLQVEDDELGLLEQRIVRRGDERDRRAVPREPPVPLDQVADERPREPVRCRAQREEMRRGLSR